MQETQVPSLGREDPLEKGMDGNTLQYSCLENPMDRGSLVGYSPGSCKESDMTEWLRQPKPVKSHRGRLA